MPAVEPDSPIMKPKVSLEAKKELALRESVSKLVQEVKIKKVETATVSDPKAQNSNVKQQIEKEEKDKEKEKESGWASVFMAVMLLVVALVVAVVAVVVVVAYPSLGESAGVPAEWLNSLKDLKQRLQGE